MKRKPSKQSLRTTSLRGQAPREPYSGLAPNLADYRNTPKSQMPRRAHNR